MSAYWISPKGEIVEVRQTHIQTIISNPETFGLTREQIEAKYKEFGETVGVEGKAREEIMVDLIKSGWVRIRRYPNKFWSINVPKLSKKIKDYLFDWADKLTSSGLFGYKEKDLYMPVKLDSVGGEVFKNLSVKDILSSALYESTQKFDSENELKLMVLKENKMKNWVDFILE